MLETDRLLLRRWKASDREPFASMNADPAVMEFFPKCLTREESDLFAAQIEEHFYTHGFGRLAAELKTDREFIGFIGLQVATFPAPFTPCIEIGWRIAAPYWNQGLATEGSHAVIDFAFRHVGLDALVSFMFRGNMASRRVMEKLGMMRDPAEDFDHPGLPVGHRLRRHVLCRLRNPYSPSHIQSIRD